MKNLRIHCLQHVAFEQLGCIENWITEMQFPLTYTKLFQDTTFPAIDDFDVLIILGGPMGIYDEEQHEWLKAEKEFIRKTLKADKKILGICLGAQLLADALGAKVFPNPEKEIGWWEVLFTKEGRTHPFLQGMTRKTTAFHWHGDTFETPPQAINLMSSSVCQNQAFVYENRVLGLQFHLEMTSQNIEDILLNAQADLQSTSRAVQTETHIRKKMLYASKNQKKMYQLLNAFLLQE